MSEEGIPAVSDTFDLHDALGSMSSGPRVWVRAEDRTKHTAAIYNQLGLPEFYALEAFVRYSGQL